MKLVLLVVALFGIGAYAEVPIPDVDPVVLILTLLKDWPTLVPFARASALVIVAVQVFKRFFPDFPYMKTVVTLSGVVIGFTESLAHGLNWYDATVFSLITSGGAVAIYNLFKHPLNTAFKVPKK